MKVIVDCWRQSLAAVTLAAVFGPASGDPSRTWAAEGGHDVPSIKVERPVGDRPAAKPEREGEHREARKEHGERKPEPREERKPEARREGEHREGPAGELHLRRARLLEQAAEIRHKLQALKPHQDDDARELKGALERIEAQLRELQHQMPNRERLQARLEELRAALRRAKDTGKLDEAERLEREARELEHLGPRAHPEGGDLQRRLEHFRVAIENLRAAGLNDQAHALAQTGERLLRGERPAAPEGGRRPEGARDAPAAAPVEHAVQELRGQVHELRQQMEEIRQHLKALAEKR